MQETTLGTFAGTLASAAPTPGGGGAAALAGALAAALGNMVGNLTVGKKKYADRAPQLRALNAKAEELRKAFLRGIDADAEAFEPLSKAYGIPKDAPGRAETLEKCLQAAAEPPRTVLRLCGECSDLIRAYADLGSPLVLSDAGCAAALNAAAARAAALNVRCNTRLMKDRACADALDRETDGALRKILTEMDGVYGRVRERLA